MLQQLGQYQIREFLGRGAMGEVYLAHHPVLDRDVAIKVLVNLAQQGPDAQDRFRREATAAARLNHPNIVTVFDFAMADGVHFLVMELVKGEDFKAVIENRSLGPAQRLEVLAQVCEGLDHAHRQGIIHRDIKPSNVRVVREQSQVQAKIMDFGIAKLDDSMQTATGLLLGTAAYLAPECIQGGQASPQSDLFAVGIMLYECLAGRNPFIGENNAHTLFRITSEDPPLLEMATLENIHPRIQTVLTRALAKNPAERFPDGLSFAHAIRECTQPGLGAKQAPILTQRRSGWAAWGLATGVVLIVAGGLAIGVGRKVTAFPPGPTSPISEPKPGSEITAGVPIPETVRVAPRVPAAPQKEKGAGVAQTSPLLQAPPAQMPMRASEAPAPQAISPIQSEERPEERFARAKELIHEDPVQAARILRSLVAIHPEDVQVQGIFLAALYFSKDRANFDTALASARAAGVKVKELIRVQAFRAALQEETRLRRDRSLSSVLSTETYARMLTELSQEEPPPVGVPPGNKQ